MTPGLGYYSNGGRPKFGHGAPPHAQGEGSDFVTAPETLAAYFGRALGASGGARRCQATGTRDEVWEFGAGSGALWPLQLLHALAATGKSLRPLHHRRSLGRLCAQQPARQRLEKHFGSKLRWVDQLARRDRRAWWWATRCWTRCPCTLLQRVRGQVHGVWHERGVVRRAPAAR